MLSDYLFKKPTGFTLAELLISIFILGILVAIAYPSYDSIIQKTRRQEAQRTLLEAAQIMEGYYAMNLSYSGAVTGSQLNIFTASEDFNDYYQLSASAAESTFTLIATPINEQSDDDCGALTITHTGSTSPNNESCW